MWPDVSVECCGSTWTQIQSEKCVTSVRDLGQVLRPEPLNLFVVDAPPLAARVVEGGAVHDGDGSSRTCVTMTATPRLSPPRSYWPALVAVLFGSARSPGRSTFHSHPSRG
jgi:hypothetical protein